MIIIKNKKKKIIGKKKKKNILEAKAKELKQKKVKKTTKMRNLVVSDLRSETKGSRFGSSCDLYAEVSFM